MFNDTRILITGGTGTIGYALVKGLIACYNPAEIVIFSRSEVNQVRMKAFFNDPRLIFIIGDISDYDSVYKACRGIDYIFHCAALKHVGICEAQPLEAVKANVFGAIHVVRAAIENEVRRAINVSSDKAVNPSSIYGNTKAVAERIFKNSSVIDGAEFLNFRSGNIFASSGSVVPLFIDNITRHNKVTLTNGEMTRFFITREDAAGMLIRLMRRGTAGYTYITDNQVSFQLRVLAESLVEKYGNKDTVITETGARLGEKEHEEIYTNDEDVYYIDQMGVSVNVRHYLKQSSWQVTQSREVIKKWIDDYRRS